MVLITPYVWTGEGGVEVLFQLINRDTVLLRSLCLLLPPPSASPIRDNVSGIDTAGSGFYDRNTVVLREAHVKTPAGSSTRRVTGLTVSVTPSTESVQFCLFNFFGDINDKCKQMESE